VNVTVLKAGLLTTVQDAGRWGFQARGVPVAGPMDPVAHRVANALVGNAREAALLEVTLLGPELEFDDERLVAVTGADFELMLDGRPAPAYGPFTVSAGPRLRFGARRIGARAYLAISGGIDVAPTLGSRATHLVSAMGGVNGRALVAGDRLPLGLRPLAGLKTCATPADGGRAYGGSPDGGAPTVAAQPWRAVRERSPPRCGCCRDRRPTTSRSMRWTCSSRRRTSSRPIRTGWASASRGRA
jgi:allophanate hydrolase subunit 2